MVKDKKSYKVVITTSGVGQRLGNLTKFTNASLVRVGKKPVISYIIESYREDVPLVVTLGHFGQQVRDFISLAYPERPVEFIDVDPFQGQGSSLGYTLMQTRESLQCSFVFHAGDAAIKGHGETGVAKNWVGYADGMDTSQYRTLQTVGSKLLKIEDKGATDSTQIYVGMAGIKDWRRFWEVLAKVVDGEADQEIQNDSTVINRLVAHGVAFEAIKFDQWFDTGNTTALEAAREKIDDGFRLLDKDDESIYIFHNSVIKFFSDEMLAAKRVARAKILAGLVPKIQGARGSFYKYGYVSGELYARVATPTDLVKFLTWAKENLWVKHQSVPADTFREVHCREFYEKKTGDRVRELLAKMPQADQETVINEEEVPGIEKLLAQVDFDWLCDAEQYRIHGDLILDNVIRTSKGYCLLDWRQDFGGLIDSGDIYYDLAKLNHNLTVNHDVVNQRLLTVEANEKGVRCDILRSGNLVDCQTVFHQFIRENGFDLAKVKVLTAIVWLNMSPLHSFPLDLFLFYHGKLNLWRALRENRSPMSSSTWTESSRPGSLSTPKQASSPKISGPMTTMGLR